LPCIQVSPRPWMVPPSLRVMRNAVPVPLLELNPRWTLFPSKVPPELTVTAPGPVPPMPLESTAGIDTVPPLTAKPPPSEGDGADRVSVPVPIFVVNPPPPEEAELIVTLLALV